MEEESSGSNVPEDEADPIVKEIPVFLSKRLEEQIYMFQYPLRPRTSKTPLNVRRCYIKPLNEAVKLEVQFNTSSGNFHTGKAQEAADRIDGPSEQRKKDKEIFFENGVLDNVEYRSAKIVDDPQNYGIGIYNGQEYHITPLKGLLRLKPYYPHLDKEVKKKEAKQKECEEESGPSTAKQITVKFSKGENDKWKKQQELSYKNIMKKYDEESWIQCDWQPEKSELSELEKMKLYIEDMQSSECTTEAKDNDVVDYLKRLVPEDQEQAIIRPSLPSNVVSFSSLKALSLVEQCKLLLKDAKIISFQQLMMLLVGCEGLTVENLLRTLPNVASLVRGNWVVKSEILYPSKTLSSVSGVPADLMCRARDYILILFTKNQFVERRKVSSVLKIPTEELKEIFMGISKLRNNKGWELSLPVNVEFINKYPDMALRQSAIWEQREMQLNAFFKDIGTSKDKKRRKSKSVSEEPSAKSAKKEGQGHPRDSSCPSSDTDSGSERNFKNAPILISTKRSCSKGSSKSDILCNTKSINS